MESKTTAIIGAIVLFLAGFFIGQITGGGFGKDKPVQVVLEDGKTLDVRLTEIYEAAAGTKKILEDITKGRGQQAQRPSGPEEGKQYTFDLANHPPRGPQGAKVTIVEFSDFQCPFCQKMATSLDEVAKKYPNDVKIIFKNRPLTSIHPLAQYAHEAVEAANAQGKFWAMHDILFQNRNALDQASIEKYAQMAGLDMGKFKSDMAANAHKTAVDKDVAEATKYGINSTPTVFVNGYYVSRPSPEAVQAMIEEQLKK